MGDNPEIRHMILNKKEIDPGQAINSIYIKRNDLYVLSEKKLFMMLMVSPDKTTK